MTSTLPDILNMTSLPKQYVRLSLWAAAAMSDDIGTLYVPIEEKAYPVRWLSPQPTLFGDSPDRGVMFRLRYEDENGKGCEVLRDGKAQVLLYL